MSDQLSITPPSRLDPIVFASDRSGRFELYLMNGDGSALRQLTSTGGNRPTWSPDGSRITFDSGQGGPPIGANVYVINADGSNLVRLTDTPGANYLPDWSPDGSKIAFTSTRDGNKQIYVMNANGSGQTRLTHDSANDAGPAWSTDGSKIAFHSDRTGNDEIWVMDAGGARQTLLTDSLGIDGFADWSRDRSHLVFDSDRSVRTTDGAVGCYGTFNIFTMTAAGRNVTPVTNSPATNAWPEYAADGAHIVFTSDRASTCNFEIWSVGIRGNELLQLTDTPGTNWFPAYAPRCSLVGSGGRFIRIQDPSNQLGTGQGPRPVPCVLPSLPAKDFTG